MERRNSISVKSRVNGEEQEYKIRIMFGITLSEIGGAQKVLFDIISSLPEERYDITLVTSPGGGQLIEWVNELNEKRGSDIKIITLQCLKRDISFINDIKAFYCLYKIIRLGHYDIVHFHSSKIGILGRCAAWLAKAPNIFFTVHGWGINEYTPFFKAVSAQSKWQITAQDTWPFTKMHILSS